MYDIVPYTTHIIHTTLQITWAPARPVRALMRAFFPVILALDSALSCHSPAFSDHKNTQHCALGTRGGLLGALGITPLPWAFLWRPGPPR